jgi:apolipoprotein N-acyltransferase
MLPLARIGGVFALGMIIVLVNALIAEMLAATRGRTALAGAALGVVLVPGIAALGPAEPSVGELDVAAVQGNVPREAFAGFGRARAIPEDEVIIGNHLAVTRRLLGGPAPDLIVWPENSFDRDPRRAPELFEEVIDLIGQIGSPMIMASILEEGEGFTNSALLVDQQGLVRARYDKVHLVPFGEYVPLGFARSLVPALRAEIPVDGIAGRTLAPFDVGGASVGVLICFESTYPALARSLVRDGAQILVVVTNNASFQGSPASRQHLAMSRMRAVEHGRVVVHAAISGISAIIGPDGRISQRSELFEQALLRETLALTDGQTPYARYGAAIEIAMGIGAALAAACALAARRREQVTV